MTHKKTGRFFPFHPALFALYPVLSLLATNLDQVPAQTALRAGIISLAGGVHSLYHSAPDRVRAAEKPPSSPHFGWRCFSPTGIFTRWWKEKRWPVCLRETSLPGGAVGSRLPGRQRLDSQEVKIIARLNQVLNIISIALILFPLWQIGAFYGPPSADIDRVTARARGSECDREAPRGQPARIYTTSFWMAIRALT